MPELAGILASAILLGFSGGISPGPLMVLLVAETLRHGATAGIKVAIAPLLSDFPIVILSFVILSQVADLDAVMGVITLAGSVVLMWLGFKGARFQDTTADTGPAPTPRTLTTAVALNFVNPNPYLFWLLIGGPLVLATWQQSRALTLVFVIVFYLLLVGSKVVIALAVHRSRALIHGGAYRWSVRVAGMALMLYALVFAWDGMVRLGVLA